MAKNIAHLKRLVATQAPDLSPYLESIETNRLLRQMATQKPASLLGLDDIVKIVREIKQEKVELTPATVDRIIEEVRPVKGRDYFTDAELIQIINFIQSNVRVPKDGKDGWEPTVEQLEAIIAPLIPKVKDGVTPIKGKHYFTEQDKKEFIEAVLSKIEVPESETIDTEAMMKAVFKELKDPKSKNRLKVSDISTDQRWHGGGLSSVVHDATLTGLGTSVSPLSVLSGGGSGFQQPTSGAVDGSNQTFVWATAPKVIVVDNGRTIQKTSSDGTMNWSGATTTVLSIAPTFDVFAIA